MQASVERIASRPGHAAGSTPPPVARYSSLARSCTARVSSFQRRQLSPVSAFAPSLPSPPSLPGQNMSASLGAQPSLDPMAASWEQAWEPGRLLTVKSPQQFSDLQLSHPEKLIVLMCKSHSCRPCKMFTRKYLSIAQRFPDSILAEIYGDETPDTRKMMMQMDVRVTPTFRMYRQGDCVNTVTGTNDKKLMRGILAAMNAAELAAHQQEIADTMSFDEADQKLAAANTGSSSS